MLKRLMIHGCYAYSYPETLAASGFQENLKNFEQHLRFTFLQGIALGKVTFAFSRSSLPRSLGSGTV